MLVMVKAQFSIDQLRSQHVSVAILLMFLKSVGGIYQLWMNADFTPSSSSSPSPGSRMTLHLLLDALISALFAFDHLVFPEHAVSSALNAEVIKPSPLHAYMCQMIGGFMFGQMLDRILALRFTCEENKLAIFKAQLLVSPLLIIVSLYYQSKFNIWDQDYLNYRHPYTLVVIVNMMVALFYKGGAGAKAE